MTVRRDSARAVALGIVVIASACRPDQLVVESGLTVLDLTVAHSLAIEQFRFSAERDGGAEVFDATRPDEPQDFQPGEQSVSVILPDSLGGEVIAVWADGIHAGEVVGSGSATVTVKREERVSATIELGDIAECGDGELRHLDGEECDDGNELDGDGCSSDCGATPCDLCDDHVDCTTDVCLAEDCTHEPNDSACAAQPDGWCDLQNGCQYPACAPESCASTGCESAVCVEGEGCVRTNLCNTAQECCNGACVPLGCNDGNPCTNTYCGAEGCEAVAVSGRACGAGPTTCSDQDTCDPDANCLPNHFTGPRAGCDAAATACSSAESCDGAGVCTRTNLDEGAEGGCGVCFDCDGLGSCVEVGAVLTDVGCDAPATPCSGEDWCYAGTCYFNDYAIGGSDECVR
jgi:hypothetical protein